jgi:hypothetical protein
MDTQFSAGPQALGYYYQVRYALLLLLRSESTSKLSIEALDDIVLEEGATPPTLLQLKHRSHASLTDSSSDLWKSLRVWSTHFQQGAITPSAVILTLVTTAVAPANSVASLLRPDNVRNPTQALRQLVEVAKTSQNSSLRPAFDAFLKLTAEQQELLINAVNILDAAPSIIDISTKIKDELRFAVRREHIEALYQRLEGWWFQKVVQRLGGKTPEPISFFEVHSMINDISDQLKPDALPIDFLDYVPPDLEAKDKQFVYQLREIAANNMRIQKAILDYYRAFEQRSRWVREDLIVSDELEKYESKLIDEWQRYALSLEDADPVDEKDDDALRRRGLQIFTWMDQEADVRIRPAVTEEYVLRGSYHMLADEPNPRVWWHPKFIERLEQLLIRQ